MNLTRAIWVLAAGFLFLALISGAQDSGQANATGFDRGLVTICVDDGYKSAHDVIRPIMKEYGLQMTLAIVSNASTSTSPGLTHPVMNADQIIELYKDGNEIISHSASHPFLTQASAAELKSELAASKKVLNTSYPVVDTFAVPYGAYNDTVKAAIKQEYSYCRTSDVGYNTPQNFDRYNIRIQYVTNTTTLATVQDWLKTAKDNRWWLVILYHNVDNFSTDEYTVDTNAFIAQMQAVKESGLPEVNMRPALDEIMPQL